ncbi:MAG: exodeoxyribonuclease VII small subunit [Chthoniobacterales bacterium]
MPKAKQDEPRSFEDSMKRLDEIVEQLEEDKLPLDKMIALYEEGVASARACGEKLEAAEPQVKVIAKIAGGALAVEELDEREDA